MEIIKYKTAFDRYKGRKSQEIKDTRNLLNKRLYPLLNKEIERVIEKTKITEDEPKKFPIVNLSLDVPITHNHEADLIKHEELVKSIITSDYKKHGWDIEIYKYMDLFLKFTIGVKMYKGEEQLETKKLSFLDTLKNIFRNNE